MTIRTIPVDDAICVNHDRFQGVANISATDDSWCTLWDTGSHAAQLVTDAETLTAEEFRAKHRQQIEER